MFYNTDLYFYIGWVLVASRSSQLAYGYKVAMISRLLKTIGLFCQRALLKRRYSVKETSIFKEPANHSHPVCGPSMSMWDEAQRTWYPYEYWTRNTISIGFAILYLLDSQYYIYWTCNTISIGLAILYPLDSQYYIYWTRNTIYIGLAILYLLDSRYSIYWTRNTLSIGLAILYLLDSQYYIYWTRNTISIGLAILYLLDSRYSIYWTCNTISIGLAILYLLDSQYYIKVLSVWEVDSHTLSTQALITWFHSHCISRALIVALRIPKKRLFYVAQWRMLAFQKKSNKKLSWVPGLRVWTWTRWKRNQSWRDSGFKTWGSVFWPYFLIWNTMRTPFVFRTCFGSIISVRACGTCKSSRGSGRR